MKHDLFISYSRVDSAFVMRLVRDLKQRGVETWLDQLDIRPGENWDDEIEKALDHAKTVIVVLSTVSAKSENVKNEIGAALERDKQVVPIVLAKGAVPLMINRLQREDFTGDYDAALSKLVHRLSGGSRTASMRAITPEEVTRIASEAAARLGVSDSGAVPPDSLSPATRQRDAAGSRKKAPKTLFAALGGALLAGGLALAFVLTRSAQPAAEPAPAASTALAALAAVEPAKTEPITAPPAAAPAPVVAPVSASAPVAAPLRAGPRGARSGTRSPGAVPQVVEPSGPITSSAPVTSLPVAPKPRPMAILCREPGYGGLCRKVPTQMNLIGTVIENDTVSSVGLGTCAAVTVCSNIQLGGTCETFTSDVPDLGTTAVGDDDVSSIRCVGPDDSPATAQPAGDEPAAE